MDDGQIVLLVFALGLFVAFGYLIYSKAKEGRAKQEALHQAYQQALKGTDRARALELGRAYYASRRQGNKLSIYDEQAITNDLSTMQ